jgi:hypothetical protein
MSWWSKKVKKYAGTALGIVGGAVLGAVTGGLGWAAVGGGLLGGAAGMSSDAQRANAKAAEKAADEQKKQIAEQEKLALAERKRKIDNLRESAGIGLLAGRRTLVSGSETGLGGTTGGMTDGLNNKLG